MPRQHGIQRHRGYPPMVDERVEQMARNHPAVSHDKYHIDFLTAGQNQNRTPATRLVAETSSSAARA